MQHVIPSPAAPVAAAAAAAASSALGELLDDGEEIPTPTTNVDVFRQDPNFADAIWALVTVNIDWRAPAVA